MNNAAVNSVGTSPARVAKFVTGCAIGSNRVLSKINSGTARKSCAIPPVETMVRALSRKNGGRQSTLNDLYFSSGSRRQVTDIQRIARKDDVSRVRHQDDGGVHRVARARETDQDAGLPPKLLIDRSHVDCGKNPRESRLSPTPVAPDLRQYDSGGPKVQAVLLGRLQPRMDIAVVSLHRDQRTCVEYQRPQTSTSPSSF